jgi:hypothetical protein
MMKKRVVTTIEKSSAECSQWLQKVNDVQNKRMTPAQREQIQERVEMSRRREESRRKVKAVKSHNARSCALMSEGLKQMTASSAPSHYLAVQTRWSAAQEASDRRQLQQLEEVDHAVQQRSVAEVYDESESDEEGMAEAAQLVGAANVLDMARQGASAAPNDEFMSLLRQLEREPNNDEEMMAKFALYETYSQQVEKVRERLFAFYEDSRLTLPQAVAQDMERQLKRIDRAEAMGIPDDAREWFVYHMMKQAGKNNKAMAAILEDFEKKLEFLAKREQEECPICLEAFSEELPAETLGCCHRVCKDCWAHWSSVMHGNPFCPLCRNEEFIQAVASRAQGA